MAWWARSLSTATMAADDDDPEAMAGRHESYHTNLEKGGGEEGSECSTRGVKEDLTELTKALSRQFWGVASFLAPPTSYTSAVSLPSCHSDPAEVSESQRIAGIRSDFAEISGRFRNGISRISSNKAVTEISKIASSFLPFGSDDSEDELGTSEGGWAIGVTAEVLAFARNIAMHPETWLDFPLYEDEEEPDDFDMSDAQEEHALVVQHHEPRLAALKIELCPTHMSEGCFWKIYFLLLHPRLSKHDAELLSTPQVVEARARWLQELQNQSRPEFLRTSEGLAFKKEGFGSFLPEEKLSTQDSSSTPYAQRPLLPELGKASSLPITDFVSEKHPTKIMGINSIDKSVIVKQSQVRTGNKCLPCSASENSIYGDDDDDEDEWPEEETGECNNSRSRNITLRIEDVSFSDLEDEDDT
ncbi:BSD domain-containing protein [Dioscorea alata]|uniref:BSD domain-containing protein n=1 Tax=Dioscorea alata TaxID=55571 RepID=A0ACB7UW66_DIOAL|nr:BSD domain-containing protein [Dioscorea alata]